MADSESLPENTEANGGRFMKFLEYIEDNPVIWPLLIPTLGPALLILGALALSGIYHAGEWLVQLVG